LSYNPWVDLGSRPHICCDSQTVELPAGNGWWLPDVMGIVLDRRLTRVERRSALAHELVHVDNGDEQVVRIGPDGPRMARRQETRADREAARRLIDLSALAAALCAHPHNPTAVADELDVTVEVLHCRLDHLRVEERAVLIQALADAEHPA
jgi:Zn-dependent peptidase ImmA (M78 family)